jgi:CDP-diacylglycerol--glycerol-3-phosphate 3-phosphatidyltransferase
LRPALVVVAVALVAAVLSMLAFAGGSRGRRDADAERKGSRLLLGLADFLIHWFLWAIGPLERLLVRAGATPDHMNAAGLAFGLLAGVLLGLGHLEAGGGVLALAGACDVLDGRLARARGVTSPYGKFIDSTLDRFVETFAFLGLVAFYRDQPVGAFVTAAGLGGSLLVSYAQARGETVNVSGSGGLMQRAERLVLMILGCLLDPALSRSLGRPAGSVLLWVLFVIAAGSLGTAAYRTVWIARQLKGR